MIQKNTPILSRKKPLKTESGASLIVVLLILVIVSILGVSGIQISMLAERGTRNERDYQIAWQSAESALLDAEYDIEGLPATSTQKRNSIFKLGSTDVSKFIDNCGNTSTSKGLCTQKQTDKPSWLSVDFLDKTDTAPTVEFGTFTSRTFTSGGAGIQPAQAPRYVIELINPSKTTDPTKAEYIYRITAMGFGPNIETQAVVQTLYRN